MDSLYRIRFSGTLIPGQEPQTVARRLAEKFRMPEKTAHDLIQQGGGRILKQNLDAAAAERYQAALTAVGLVAAIEPQDASGTRESESLLGSHSTFSSTVPTTPSLRKDAPADPPRLAPGSGWTQCPKCGAPEVSELTGVCQACGIVVERYLANRGGAATTGSQPAGNRNTHAPADPVRPALDTEDTLHPPRAVSAGRGWGWIADAWPLFKDRPGAWIGMVLLCYLILIVLSLVPLIGGLATTVIGPMLTAGLMIGAHLQFRGEGFAVSHLFAGFATRPGPLALVGLAYLLFAIGIGLVIFGLFMAMLASGGMAMDAAMLDPDTFDPESIDPFATLNAAFALPVLVAMLLSIPLAMAMFFAPLLVALNDVPVLQSFKLSFMGCLKNLLPFLLFGLIAMAMIFVGSLPLMLGLLVVMPLLTIAVYMSYRDIFYR